MAASFAGGTIATRGLSRARRRVFHTLKTELVYQHRYRTREEARLAIFDYIAAFYNRTRRHSSNAYRSPDEQEAPYAVRGT